MQTPTQILFALAGSPAQDGCAPLSPDDRCRIHGGLCEGRGMLYGRWAGNSFTDQNKLKDWSAETVCEACVWAHAWNVPPGFPPPEDGKKGVNLRLYSHFWHDGEYHAWNKANKREIREWLRTSKSGPWFAAIADTGQKHVLPWTPMNFGGPGDLPARGVVRFEEQNVRLGSFALIDAMCELLTAGATKEEIETGQYTPRAWQLARKTLEAFEDDHGRRSRGGAWFSLALFLSQRDEMAVLQRQAQNALTTSYSDSDRRRFWERVSKSEDAACWTWTGARSSKGGTGYGKFFHRGAMVFAHRVSLEMHLGRALAADMVAMHTCDNPPCCNPRHLREASQSENMEDAIEKGIWNPSIPRERHGSVTRPEARPRGERVHCAKLTEEMVAHIRARASGDGYSPRALARELGISHSQIIKVVQGSAWKHVESTQTKEVKRADKGAKGGTPRSNGRGSARPESGVPDGGSEPAQALGPAAGPPAKRGKAKRDEQRVGNRDDEKPRTEQPKYQLGLFD